jgi:hypothetical protein
VLGGVVSPGSPSGAGGGSQVAAVPEPSTLLLVLAAAFALSAWLLRRQA